MRQDRVKQHQCWSGDTEYRLWSLQKKINQTCSWLPMLSTQEEKASQLYRANNRSSPTISCSQWKTAWNLWSVSNVSTEDWPCESPRFTEGVFDMPPSGGHTVSCCQWSCHKLWCLLCQECCVLSRSTKYSPNKYTRWSKWWESTTAKKQKAWKCTYNYSKDSRFHFLNYQYIKKGFWKYIIDD